MNYATLADAQPATMYARNPKGWGPDTIQPCPCIACERIRAFEAGRQYEAARVQDKPQ